MNPAFADLSCVFIVYLNIHVKLNASFPLNHKTFYITGVRKVPTKFQLTVTYNHTMYFSHVFNLYNHQNTKASHDDYILWYSRACNFSPGTHMLMVI